VLSAADGALADVWDNSTGSAFWSSASNWADDSEPTAADNVFFPSGFPGGANVIFLDNAPSETAVGVFFEDDYTLTGIPLDSSLQLFSPGNIGVDPGKTANLNTLLHDFVGLTKVGNGTLVLNNGSNNFTGTVSVAAGTLKPGPGAIGSNPVNISPGAMLEVNGTTSNNSVSINAGTLNGFGLAQWNGTITVGTGTSTLASGPSSSETFTIGNAADDLTGGASGTLAVTGSGTVILPFSNNYSGGWQVSSGTLRANNANSLGSGTTPITVTGPGKLEIALNTALTRGLNLGNGATVKLQSGNASITGTTAIAAGANVTFQTNSFFDTLNIGDASAGLSGGGGGGGSSITFTGGGFFVLGYASSYVGTLIANNATVRISADANLGNALNAVSLTNSLLGVALGSGAVNSTRHITNLGDGVLAAGSGSTWTLNGPLTSSGNLYAQGDGNITIGGNVSFSPGSTLFLNGGVGMVTLNTDVGSHLTRNLTVNVNFSNVTFNANEHLASLIINSGQTATVAAAGNRVVATTTLSVGGKLDLKDNKLITTTAVGTWNGSNYTGVTQMIRLGRNGNTTPLWDGASGIITSQSTATSGNLHSIGIARGSEVKPQTTSVTALWGGQTITGSDTLVMYTYGGDANLDGTINILDYVRIDQGLAASLTGWSNGDFNYDGKINVLDYADVIDSNIGNQSGIFPTATAAPLDVATVPEPSSSLLIVCAGCALRRRRRG
jgi:autotransporter-associated beta strand protein